MRFSFTLLALLASSALAAPGPALKIVEKASGSKKESSYIVTLGDGVMKSNVIEALGAVLGAQDSITHADGTLPSSTVLLRSYLQKLSTSSARTLMSLVLRKTPSSASSTRSSALRRTACRRSMQPRLRLPRSTHHGASVALASVVPCLLGPLRRTKTMDMIMMPEAVLELTSMWLANSGILTTHAAFGGRARWSTTFGGYDNKDNVGHGTHVAGIVGGARVGVARSVSLIAVKVGDVDGPATSDIISGLNWVKAQVAASGRPSVATMSLGGGVSLALDDAASSAVNAGIHVTISAGNSNSDANTNSPARAAGVITVGASTITDERASFSDYGSVVEVFAPGVEIYSSYNTGDTDGAVLSGTSMAVPFVAGLVAYLIGMNGDLAPNDTSNWIIDWTTKDALSNIPQYTPNRVIYNGAEWL